MMEKKYIAVNPEDDTSSEVVKLINSGNEFRGTLMSANTGDASDVMDVRQLFVSHVKVDGKNIQATTQNDRRTVDITPHVELNPVTTDDAEPIFSDWTITPRTTPVIPSSQNLVDIPSKRLVARQRDDGKWVVCVVVQEPDEEHELVLRDITSGKGSYASLDLKWTQEEIDYPSIPSITISRQIDNLLGYRLGEKDGINEGKLLQAAGEGQESLFGAWKRGRLKGGLSAGTGATASVDEQIVQDAIAFGTNAQATAQGAI